MIQRNHDDQPGQEVTKFPKAAVAIVILIGLALLVYGIFFWPW